MTDEQLLIAFATRRDESAFAELVRRHINWVHTAVARKVHDRHLAEDVTQAVFIALALKAAKLPTDRPLAGWLFRALRFSCAHALRADARRKHHERKAAEMISSTSPVTADSEWSLLAPMLDDQVARLGSKDREVVLLRFFQQKSFADMGHVLGVSEEAARKQTGRAVDRLRALLIKQNLIVATSSGLAAVLIASATQPTAAALSVSVATTAVAAVNGVTATGPATMIARGAIQRMMMMSLMQAAAAVVLIGLLITSVIGGGDRMRTKPSAPQSILPSAAIFAVTPPAIDLPESEVTGETQAVQWSVILTPGGADAIRSLAKPVKTASKVYEAMICNGAELRAALSNAIASRTVTAASKQMDWMPLSKYTILLRPPIGVFDTAGGVAILGGPETSKDAITHLATGGAHVSIDDPDLNTSVGEIDSKRGWKYTRMDGGGIAFDGNLAAGDALVFMGKYTGASGKDHYHLMVWETVKATTKQVDYLMAQTDTRWWCENGPAPLRRWADAARLWETKVPHDQAAVAPTFEKKLEDGRSIQLIALSRPQRWPFCWWDALGRPEQVLINARLNGDPPPGIWAKVVIVNHGTTMPTQDASYTNETEGQFEEGAGELRVGVLVGSWIQVGQLQLNVPATIAGTTYLLEQPRSIGPKYFLAQFHRTRKPENEQRLIAVGDIDSDMAWPPQQILFKPSSLREDEPNFSGIELKDVKFFRLLERKRQWVPFTGFASSPKESPPTQTTTAEVETAENQWAAEQAQVERARRAAMPSDPSRK